MLPSTVDGSTLHILNSGLAAQNFALNVAEHGFKISVYNRSYEKTEACVTRAGKEREWLPVGYLDSAANNTHAYSGSSSGVQISRRTCTAIRISSNS